MMTIEKHVWSLIYNIKVKGFLLHKILVTKKLIESSIFKYYNLDNNDILLDVSHCL